MKKALAALVGLAVLLGVGMAVFFGLFAEGGVGQAPDKVLAVGLYGQGTSGSWNCDDINDILNPPGADRFPPVVAVIEAEDVGPPIEIPGSGVASAIAGRARNGRPYADDEQALKDSEDGVLLYIAIVRQGNPDVVVSEDKAKAYLRAHPPGPCEAGGLVAMPGLTEDQLIRGIQIGETTNNFIQEAIESSARSGNIPSMSSMDQTIADLIAQARPTVKITEVAFAATGGLECTEGGVKVACPADVLAPQPSATPTAGP